MKKALTLVLCLIMSLSFLTVVCSAAGSAAITAESVTAKKGETVSVKINITSNPGIAYLRLTPEYSDKLTLVSAENGISDYDFDSGLNLVWSADSDIKKTGTLATLKFKVAEDAEPGELAVSVKCRECYNSSFADVNVSTSAGKVTVSAKKPCEDVVITAPSGNKTVKWRFKATVKASAVLPSGYKLQWYQGNSAVSGQTQENGKASFTTDELRSNAVYTVKIVDADNKVVSTSGQEKTVNLNVKSDFFTKLSAFFSRLFKKNAVTFEN